MGKLLGADIERSARIGLSTVDGDVLEMGPGSRVGHLTVLRGLRRTRLFVGLTNTDREDDDPDGREA